MRDVVAAIRNSEGIERIANKIQEAYTRANAPTK